MDSSLSLTGFGFVVLMKIPKMVIFSCCYLLWPTNHIMMTTPRTIPCQEGSRYGLALTSRYYSYVDSWSPPNPRCHKDKHLLIKVLKMTRRLLHCEDSFSMLGTAGKVENHVERHVIARHRSGPSGDICDGEYRHRGSYLLLLNLSHQNLHYRP
jgi:hypothetical protein